MGKCGSQPSPCSSTAALAYRPDRPRFLGTRRALIGGTVQLAMAKAQHRAPALSVVPKYECGKSPLQILSAVAYNILSE